jgi:GNAT superfamily N-acetyltransferase
LFVEERARGRGAGRALLSHLCRLAHREGYARIEWVTASANARGLDFYQRSGARVQETVRVLRLDPPAIAELARASEARPGETLQAGASET